MVSLFLMKEFKRGRIKKLGGQAIINGVMFISKEKVVCCVRKGKKILMKKERLRKKPRFFNAFFVRGIVNLLEMLVLGTKALVWSANQESEKNNEEITKFEIFLSLFLAIVFAILLFIVLPFFLAKLFITNRGMVFNLVDGAVRVIVFFIYLILISRMKDVKKLFQYHGAEHRAVNCYEAGKKLTIKNCKKFSTLNKRCGTSFLMIVLVVSIIVFSLITIPVIAGISYEILKFSERTKNRFVDFLVLPGLWLQKITTAIPSDEQQEVAIYCLKESVKR